MRNFLRLFAIIITFGIAIAPTVRAEDTVIASGTFHGKNGHAASGSVDVVKTSNGIEVLLRDDFRFDGAPDPKLGFGKGGYFKSTKFSALTLNKGGQRYKIPPGINAALYPEIWIWCEKYAVPLGLAVLKKSK